MTNTFDVLDFHNAEVDVFSVLRVEIDESIDVDPEWSVADFVAVSEDDAMAEAIRMWSRYDRG